MCSYSGINRSWGFTLVLDTKQTCHKILYSSVFLFYWQQNVIGTPHLKAISAQYQVMILNFVKVQIIYVFMEEQWMWFKFPINMPIKHVKLYDRLGQWIYKGGGQQNITKARFPARTFYLWPWPGVIAYPHPCVKEIFHFFYREECTKGATFLNHNPVPFPYYSNFVEKRTIKFTFCWLEDI